MKECAYCHMAIVGGDACSSCTKFYKLPELPLVHKKLSQQEFNKTVADALEETVTLIDVTADNLMLQARLLQDLQERVDRLERGV